MEPRQLKGFSDETLVRFLISMSRDRFDPLVKKKPTIADAELTIKELLIRMGTGSINCPFCGNCTKQAAYCSYCGAGLDKGETNVTEVSS